MPRIQNKYSLTESWTFTAITQGSIVQTIFHGDLMAIFPKEFHDPMNAESTELSKVQQGP